MKEDEIMVGDYVSVWDGKPESLQCCIEVKGILDGEVYYDIEDDEGKPLRIHSSVKHCHPLKLTTRDMEQYGLFFDDLLFDYEWHPGSERFTEPTLQSWSVIEIAGKRFRVNYVHQLQHIMKVCKSQQDSLTV